MSDAATLLYVEDEVFTQVLVKTALNDAGFKVMLAANGADGLKLVEANSKTFRGLITDINLGKGADGWDVARRARELDPEMPVVYVSGASKHEWASKGVPSSVMIAKPFAPAQIVVAISSLLITADIKL